MLSPFGWRKEFCYLASIGFYNDAGWTIADKVSRFTANVKNTFYISDKFTATLTTQANVRSQKAPGTMPQRKNNTLGVFERDFDIIPSLMHWEQVALCVLIMKMEA